MPDKPVFLPTDHLLPVEELAELCSRLVEAGVDEIRLTGGEPLLRKDFIDIVQSLAHLPLRKFALTTNGFHLGQYLDPMKEAGINSINISVDSLKADRFFKITKRDAFEEVIRQTLRAADMGFRTKVNAVAMRGVNDDELWDYIDFSKATGIEVRFLELMKIGPEQQDFSEMFISMNEMLERIKTRFKVEVCKAPKDNTAREFKIEGGAKIGFIASESQSFCNTCSRLRLTATGQLRSCLFRDDGINVRGLSESEFDQVLTQVAAMKPLDRIEKIEQPMYAIGG